ncbi:AAA family ATPase [Altererythrobacter aurantiacus]|uniref:AAA family ATPase n=1 Tax=Parapontixanthobacter aurantiacus TaxID=1463599 RepID=A0A844ZH16_9SPHN|nr:AAA family ATPase [Parapontixanthobacter aurantiacus]
MARSAPLRAAVTGAPGAGKSTLLDHLAGHGIATGPEVARTILQQPGGMELRASDPHGFAFAMLEAQLASWHEPRNGAETVVFDRGFPDIIGFLRVEGLAVPGEIDRVCRELRYDGPIFHAPAWADIYRQDAERIQNWDEAVASDNAVVSAWRDYGYAPVLLPLASPEKRAAFVRDHLPD